MSEKNMLALRGRNELLLETINLLTEAARLRRTRLRDTGGEESSPADFAEFVSLAVAGAPANIGGIDQILAGWPESWEADHVRNLLVSTVGWDEDHLWGNRTEPLVVLVDVDRILTELGICTTYDESEAEMHRLEDAIGLVYDECDTDGTWIPSVPTAAAPLSPDVVAAMQHLARPLTRAYREPSPEQADQLNRIDDMRDQLDRLRERQWADYGEAFKASVLMELAREPIKGLPVPVDVHVTADVVGSGLDGLGDSDLPLPVIRLLEAAWLTTPLPGSGLAPKDHPPGSDIAEVEKAEGRLPHHRLMCGNGDREASCP